MTTLSQLLEIMMQQNIGEFSNKSKIQAIVDGEPLEEVTIDHIRMIKNKLKTLRILNWYFFDLTRFPFIYCIVDIVW